MQLKLKNEESALPSAAPRPETPASKIALKNIYKLVKNKRSFAK